MQAASNLHEVHSHRVALIQSKKSREFIWTVLTTFEPDFVKKLVEHADGQRHVEHKDLNLCEQVLFCNEVVKMFANINYISSKYVKLDHCTLGHKGRSLTLMKKYVQRQPRKKNAERPVRGTMVLYVKEQKEFTK